MLSPERSSVHETGIRDIDEQHRAVIRLAAKICDPANRDQPLTEALAELLSYASFHFSAEEDLMARVNYPSAERHAREHRDFEAQMMDFAYRRPEQLKWEPIAQFVEIWIRHHLLTFDAELARFCRPPRQSGSPL